MSSKPIQSLFRRSLELALTVALALTLGACTNVPKRPKLATRLAPAPVGVKLDPPAPDDVFWVKISRATLPLRTLGEQSWDEDEGLPDPLVVLKVRRKEVLRTATVTDQLNPTWTGESGNFKVTAGDQLELQVLDADTLNETSVGKASLNPATNLGENALGTGDRGELIVVIEPARAFFGLGFDYRATSSVVHVAVVLENSPASRGGMKQGDQIVVIGGKKTNTMTPKEVKSMINAIGRAPVSVVVKHMVGTTETISLSEGPVYPLYGEFGPIE